MKTTGRTPSWHHARVQANFLQLGHRAVSVPMPGVTEKDLHEWREAELALSYRPAESELSLASWLNSNGQSGRLRAEPEAREIVWEPCETGYWFLAEAAVACPRLGIASQNDLLSPASGITLLSLEEYAFVFWTYRALTGSTIDVRTHCGLRTRCGQGGLHAHGSEGRVTVRPESVTSMAAPFWNGGGRSRRVIPSA